MCTRNVHTTRHLPAFLLHVHRDASICTESDPEPAVSTGAKRSASPGQWTLEIEPIAVADGKRSPQWEAGVNYDVNSNRLGGTLSYNSGNHKFGASASYGQGGLSSILSYTYSFRRRSA